MAFSEGLSDDGELTGRGNPVFRGIVTGQMTFIGGFLHTLPFSDPERAYGPHVGVCRGRCETDRDCADPHGYFKTSFALSFVQVVGGAVDRFLMSGVPERDEDVVHFSRRPRIADKVDIEVDFLREAVMSSHCNDWVRFESVKDILTGGFSTVGDWLAAVCVLHRVFGADGVAVKAKITTPCSTQSFQRILQIHLLNFNTVSPF